jgi:HAD superfamily hydrolase (TIGR01450 family)
MMTTTAPERLRLRACRAFLLDMDGTLYVDEKLVPGAADLVALLAERGLPRLFLTNNSSARGEDYRARLERLGIPARRDQVFTSGDATIHYLLAQTPYRTAYVVGTPALEDEFRAAGIGLDAPDPDCVVVGFDRTLTYAKLERATALLFAGKPYLATHPDKTCITRHGLIPDVAAVIGALEAVTGRAPKIIGKPHPEIVAQALDKLGARPEATVMIGDQLDTDMTLARSSGILGVLVMSGETTPEKLAAWPAADRPPLVATSVAEILDWLR